MALILCCVCVIIWPSLLLPTGWCWAGLFEVSQGGKYLFGVIFPVSPFKYTCPTGSNFSVVAPDDPIGRDRCSPAIPTVDLKVLARRIRVGGFQDWAGDDFSLRPRRNSLRILARILNGLDWS